MKNYKKGLPAVGIAKGNRGFTLIELLVVIAIIGVLASVVLAATNSARNKAEDAKIMSNLKTVQTQSSIYLENNNMYYSSGPTIWTGSVTANCNTSGSFMADPIIAQAIASILVNNGSPLCNYLSNGAPGYMTSWAMVFPLKAQANTYVCIDSTGTLRKNHTNGTAYSATSGAAPAALSSTSDYTCN